MRENTFAVPTISVMISTKDRAADVKELLGCLVEQTWLPKQVVIVDASSQDTLGDYLATQSFPFTCNYIHTQPGVMRQRNLGVINCFGEYIVCLDDDLLLEQDYIEELLAPFFSLRNDRLSAVIGQIVDDRAWYARSPWSIKLKFQLRQIISDLFLLEKVGDGRFRYSGLATFAREDGQSHYVECISGGCVAYRRAVFDTFRFDENLYFAVFDDIDTAKRLQNEGHQVYYQSSAKVWHKKSPGGRVSRMERSRIWVAHYHYTFCKNWPQTPLRRLAFWWAVLGQLIWAGSDREMIQGIWAGVRHIRQSSSPLEAVKKLHPIDH